MIKARPSGARETTGGNSAEILDTASPVEGIQVIGFGPNSNNSSISLGYDHTRLVEGAFVGGREGNIQTFCKAFVECGMNVPSIGRGSFNQRYVTVDTELLTFIF